MTRQREHTEGEQLFTSYLEQHGIPYRFEHLEKGKSRPPDFTIDHADKGEILCEVKDIRTPFPERIGPSAFDPYKPIRSHIDAGRKKFKEYKNRLCILVLYGGNGFVDLSRPDFMLGAMYGDSGWTLPFNPDLGRFDSSRMERQFLRGRGKMVQTSGLSNTRMSALLTLHKYNVAGMRQKRFIEQNDGRSRAHRIDDVLRGTVNFADEARIGVTVWENAVAVNKLPRNLFRGAMDDWWTVDAEYQTRSFVGCQLGELETKAE
jgi:hypothetical protein